MLLLTVMHSSYFIALFDGFFRWLSGIGVKIAYIEPGNPWENGFSESFNGTS